MTILSPEGDPILKPIVTELARELWEHQKRFRAQRAIDYEGTYIENQKEHHRNKPFKDEIEVLKGCGMGCLEYQSPAGLYQFYSYP